MWIYSIFVMLLIYNHWKWVLEAYIQNWKFRIFFTLFWRYHNIFCRSLLLILSNEHLLFWTGFFSVFFFLVSELVHRVSQRWVHRIVQNFRIWWVWTSSCEPCFKPCNFVLQLVNHIFGGQIGWGLLLNRMGKIIHYFVIGYNMKIVKVIDMSF